MAKHHKKAPKAVRAARPVRRAHGKKSTRVKKAVSQQDHVLRKVAVEQQGFEPDAAELQLVDLAALVQKAETVASVVEVYEVEVAGQNEEPNLR